MMDKIPTYGKKNLESKITLWIPRELKDQWDLLHKKHKVKTAEITRQYLEKVLPELLRELEK